MRLLLAFFFISGFPALIYQIIWQRALFNVFGSNIEAVTLVVSAFMLGLGVGSLAGGKLSSNPRIQPLILFALFELAIGIFGIFSLPLIEFVSTLTISATPTGTFIASFLTVLIPTFLMGATLPLLLMHLVNKNGNVGQSVSHLYYANTWGSAVACFAGALLIFGSLGMHGSTYLAAALNICVGIGALILAKNNSPIEEYKTAQKTQIETSPQLINPKAAILIAGFSGFIALSYEILWTRAFFLELMGRAYAFPFVLGFFLIGIAIGAKFAQKHMPTFRKKIEEHGYLPFAALFLSANVASFLVIPSLIHFGDASRALAVINLIISAALFGSTLPLLSEISVNADNNAGKKVSHLYVANIIGSTSGTIITGLWLLDTLPLQAVAASLFIIGLVVCCILFFFQPSRTILMAGCSASLISIVPVLLFAAPALHDNVYEALQFNRNLESKNTFKHISETKSGVVTITDDNVVYGTGVYDGLAQVNLAKDRNGLFRATALSAVHPAPKEILVIGLSLASWTQVLANLDGVEKVTAIEINSGYLDLIKQYPDIKSVLNNPKIDIVIDDGRRWLKRNPDKKFDAIIANTTFFWRSGASNLLSTEYLTMVKSHLKQGGIYYYNTTSSDRVQRTGATVFPYAARYQHFLMGSNAPIIFDKDRWYTALKSLKIDGTPALNFKNPNHLAIAKAITATADRIGSVDKQNEMKFAIEFKDSILNRTTHLELITDNNMGGEWSSLFMTN